MSLHDFTAANSIRRDKDDYDTRLDLGSDKFCEVCKDRWQEQ